MGIGIYLYAFYCVQIYFRIQKALGIRCDTLFLDKYKLNPWQV